MFKTTIEPRIGETDALRHINNLVPCQWFEIARNPIFKIFNSKLELTYKKWNLIIVRAEYNYLKQIYYGYDVEIRSYITKIGNSSFTIYHEAWQNGQLTTTGIATLVYFDFIHQKSMTITDEIREELKKHLVKKDEIEKKNKKEMNENKKNPIKTEYTEY